MNGRTTRSPAGPPQGSAPALNHIMLAAHVIFGVYGFWLPNDPRGSWSTFVGSWELFRHGAATKTSETRSLATRRHDHNVRFSAKRDLQRPAVQFTGLQARAIGTGFAEYLNRTPLRIHACAILPDHVHLVLFHPQTGVGVLANHLKGAAAARLTAERLHPFADWPARHGRPQNVSPADNG